MAGRGRHIRGTLWTAITVVIAAVAMTLPQRAHAGGWPVAPAPLAQAGLAAAQNAVDAATAAVSAAQPTISVAQPAVVVPAVTGVAPAGTPVAPTRAAAAPAAAPARTAPRPAAVTERAAARVPRPPVPHPASARAAGPPLPVAASAARAGAAATPAASAAPGPAVSAISVPGVSVPGVSVPGVSVSGVSVPGVSVPGVSVAGVSVPPIQIPVIPNLWPPGWPSVFTSVAPAAGAPASALGVLPSMGWPLSTAATSLSGILPAPLRTSGPGGVFVPGAALTDHRHRSSRFGHPSRSGAHSAVGTGLAARGWRPVMSGSWSAPAARRPLPTHASASPAPRLHDHGAQSPRPARPASESSTPAPPLTSPITGGGAAAAASAGGGGGAAVMLTAAALILIFLLSTRVSLDIAAWRSTLLCLRLERPG